MASDDIVWSIIGTDFCSFKLKTRKDQTFCREPNNVSGFCSRQSCPLANSQYATIRAEPSTGNLCLYIKAIERSHLPSKWYEKIKLPRNYTQALQLVDSRLQYYPKFILHKCKQRLTRLTQVRIRVQKLAKEEERLGEKLVPRLSSKVRRREEVRERKALAAAKVERAIERTLIDRLRAGAYGDRPLNVEPNVWKRVMRGLEKEGQALRDEDLDEGIEEEDEAIENEYEEELENAAADVEYVSDIEGESDDDLEDFEDWIGGQSPEEDDDEDEESGSASGSEEEEEESEEEDVDALKKTLANLKRKRPTGPPPKPKKKSTKDTKGPRREIEYEIEREPPAREVLRM